MDTIYALNLSITFNWRRLNEHRKQPSNFKIKLNIISYFFLNCKKCNHIHFHPWSSDPYKGIYYDNKIYIMTIKYPRLKV